MAPRTRRQNLEGESPVSRWYIPWAELDETVRMFERADAQLAGDELRRERAAYAETKEGEREDGQ
jgi:hypothetical protein